MPAQKIPSIRLPRDEIHSRIFEATVYEIFRLERVALRFDREESPQQKVGKLEGFLVQYGVPLAEAVPLFAALLPLPLPADYAPLTMSPEQHKQ